MPKRLYRSFQALLLLALCIFFAAKVASGQLTYYINLRFIPLTIFGTIFLAVLAQTMFTEIKRSRQRQHAEAESEEHDHDHAPASANLHGDRGTGEKLQRAHLEPLGRREVSSASAPLV